MLAWISLKCAYITFIAQADSGRPCICHELNETSLVSEQISPSIRQAAVRADNHCGTTSSRASKNSGTIEVTAMHSVFPAGSHRRSKKMRPELAHFGCFPVKWWGMLELSFGTMPSCSETSAGLYHYLAFKKRRSLDFGAVSGRIWHSGL